MMYRVIIAVAFFCYGLQANQRPFFQAKRSQPYHLSVGAVLFNEEGLVACHHFKNLMGHKDFYILMRESMEDGETILQTLDRGLVEEFGATAKPAAFLGCLTGYLPDDQFPFDKSTLYIACQCISWDPNKRDAHDPEAISTIEWLEPEMLIQRMQMQGAKFHRVDADESEDGQTCS